MMRDRTTYYAIFANIFMFVLSYIAYRQGYIQEALANDIAYIIPAIGVVLVWGLITVWRAPKYSRWGVDICIALGLVGTALGVWEAFSAVNPDDIAQLEKVAGIVSNVINGLGSALWTTICGTIAGVWLSTNLLILTRDYEA